MKKAQLVIISRSWLIWWAAPGHDHRLVLPVLAVVVVQDRDRHQVSDDSD